MDQCGHGRRATRCEEFCCKKKGAPEGTPKVSLIRLILSYRPVSACGPIRVRGERTHPVYVEAPGGASTSKTERVLEENLQSPALFDRHERSRANPSSVTQPFGGKGSFP